MTELGIHQKFIDSLIEAEKAWQSADHLAYVTIPVVKDPRLMIRALESIHKSAVLAVSTILKFEYLYKRVELTGDSRKNLDNFFKRCSQAYGLTKEDNIILREIMFLGKKHRESGFEFSKSGKVVILDDNMGSSELSMPKVREFLMLTKKLLENTNRAFKSRF